MKHLLLLLGLISSFFTCSAQVHVDGYYRSNGTYVEPHYRSSPDGNPYNNYSYPGNYNPYTGKVAGGSEEAYLANYYKAYSSYGNYTGNSNNLDNYNYNLLNVNYWGVQIRDRSDITNTTGANTGYIKQSLSDPKMYFIYDVNDINIGMVSFKQFKYTIYDGAGMKLYSVNSNGTIRQPDNGVTAYVLVMLGVLTGALVLAL